MGLIQAVTRYLFIENEPGRADVILVPGCSFPEPMERAARLYLSGAAPVIVPSGNCWIFRRGTAEGMTECEIMTGIARRAGVPAAAILGEDRARHTLDNARLSWLVLEQAGLTVKTAIICCQSFHARRCLKAYGRYFQDVKLTVCTVPTQGFDATNWYKKPRGIFKAITELLKCTNLFFFLISFAKA
jgi:uncharacterized SAM-binding protein YcdF (DUF218 family)